jgi:hypothetical protein
VHSLVKRLERELLTPFQECAERLRTQFPNVWTRVESQSVGSLTEYQGHQIVIDCLLKDAPDHQPDNVALGVGLQDLTANPIIDADVCWGHPSGHVEAEFSSEPIEVSEQVLIDLYADLPRLYVSLIEAIKRGEPSDWNVEPERGQPTVLT